MSVMHLYGSGTGCVILRGGYKLRVFGETVLSIFGPESYRVGGL
jgi:hypothetical protein